MGNSLCKNRVNRYLSTPFGEVDALFNQFFGPGLKTIQRSYFTPASVWEEDDAYHVQLDVPGVSKDDVEVTFDKGVLSIGVERKTPEKKGNGYEERSYGKSVREVKLSAQVDPESISAELSDGVLHVSVSKTPEAQPKRIEIK